MRIGGPNTSALLFLLSCAVCLSGCAQITVVAEDHPPKSEWRFGVLAVEVAPSNKNTIVSTSGFGLISNPSGATLGYSNARIVRIGDECRLVIQLHDALETVQEQEIRRLLKSVPHACEA